MTRGLIALQILALPLTAFAQQAPTPQQIEAMVAKMRPGPEHQALTQLVGTWNQEITYDMGGAKKLTVKGTATNRLILGGRFLTSERTADNPAGAVYGEPKAEALSIYGFDRRNSQYTILELDSLGTYWVSAAGSKAEAGSIVMSGETEDDHGGRKEIRKYDMVLRFVDADTYVTQIIFKFPGKAPLTLVETLSRRVK